MEIKIWKNVTVFSSPSSSLFTCCCCCCIQWIFSHICSPSIYQLLILSITFHRYIYSSISVWFCRRRILESEKLWLFSNKYSVRSTQRQATRWGEIPVVYEFSEFTSEGGLLSKVGMLWSNTYPNCPDISELITFKIVEQIKSLDNQGW